MPGQQDSNEGGPCLWRVRGSDEDRSCCAAYARDMAASELRPQRQSQAESQTRAAPIPGWGSLSWLYNQPCGDLILQCWSWCQEWSGITVSQHKPKWVRHTDVLLVSRRGNAPSLFPEDQPRPPLLHRHGPTSWPGAPLPNQLGG